SLLLVLQSLGDSFGSLPHHDRPEEDRAAQRGGPAQNDARHVRAVAGVHRLLRLRPLLAIFPDLEREHAGRNLLLREARSRFLVADRHDHRLWPLSAALSAAVAHRLQAETARDDPALRLGLADALLRRLL